MGWHVAGLQLRGGEAAEGGREVDEGDARAERRGQRAAILGAKGEAGVGEQQAVVVQQQRGVWHELEARRVRRGHHGDPQVEHVARARAQQRGPLGVAGARVLERLVQQL